MACGAGALIVILSTFNGFENLSRSLNESFQPDLTISVVKNKQFELDEAKFLQIKKVKGVAAVSRVLEEKVYVKYLNTDALASMKGVDESYFQTNKVNDYIIGGDSVLENETYSFGLLGAGIASKLQVNINNQFDPIAVYCPKSEVNTTSLNDGFELSYLTPGGVFSIYQDYDEKYIIAPLSFVQYLRGHDESVISALEVKVSNENNLKSIQSDIQEILGTDFKVKSRLELNESFYRISQIEKLVTVFILSFILVILSFNFIGSLTMHIIEKHADIKMLHYMGMTENSIFKLYLVYGLSQGVLGGVLGLFIGVVICILQYTFGIVKMPGSGTFVIQDYPVMIYLEDVIMILAILVLVSVLASYFPAKRAAAYVQNLSLNHYS